MLPIFFNYMLVMVPFEIPSGTNVIKTKSNYVSKSLNSIYWFFDYGIIQSLFNFKSYSSKPSDVCSNETHTDVVIVGYMYFDHDNSGSFTLFVDIDWLFMFVRFFY